MFIKAKGKKKCIKRASILALAGVIMVGTVLATTQQAMAKPTLPGVERIILDNSTENPFVILEIVPDMADASLGYFVAGEEPVDDSGKSIKDMPSKEERTKRFGNALKTSDSADIKNVKEKITDLGIDVAVSIDISKDDAGNEIGIVYEELDAPSDTAKSVDIRGTFKEDENGDYNKIAVGDMYQEIKVIDAEEGVNTLKYINENNINLYRQYVSFDTEKGENEDVAEKRYAITLSVLEDTLAVPVDITKGILGEQAVQDNQDTVFNGQFFVADPIEFDVYEREISDENETGNESDDGQSNTPNKTTEKVIEYTNPPKKGDLIFKVEGDKLTYVGVMESDIDVATLSLRITEEEDEDVQDEEELEGLEDEGTVDGIVDGTVDGADDGIEEGSDGGEVGGDKQENGSGNIGNDTQTPGQGPGEGNNDTQTPGQGPGEGNNDTQTPGQGLEGGSQGSETPGSGNKTPESGNVNTETGSKVEGDDSKTPGQGTNSESKPPENQNGGSEGNSGDNTENINDTVRLNNSAIALRKAGFFVPTQIGMMYRMSVSLAEYKNIEKDMIERDAKYVIVREADGGDTDVEYYYYISGLEEVSDGGLYATTSFGEIVRPNGGYGSDSDIYNEAYYENRTFYQYAMEKLPYTYDIEDKGGEYSFAADYTQQVYDTVNYNGGFANAEWFKRFVFDLDDEKLAEMSIDVVPVTMDELSQEHLDKADLIYFSNASNEGFQLGQNSYDAICKAILKKASENIPVVMDYGLYANVKNHETLRKMAACLLHNDILEPFGEAGLGDENTTFGSLALDNLAKTMKQPMEGSTSLSCVNGNIFIYDCTIDDANGGVDGSTNNQIKKKAVVSGDFNNEIYTQEEISYGFQELLDEIENENFYLEVAGKKDRIESKVTMATAIRHIINFGDRRNVTKTTLRVLDLEPYDFEDYYPESETPNKYTAYKDIRTKDGKTNVDRIETDSICLTADGKLNKTQWIIQNLAPQFENNIDDLSVTIMGTKEFVGKIDDINENYDLIYLGMDTSIMNTEIDTVPSGKGKTIKVKSNRTVYNDSNMKNLVYAHVGDIIQSYVSDSNGAMSGDFRLSGNDITFDKLRELTEYIEAGYAVIISDEMVIKNKNSDSYRVNKDKIDESSNMYTLLDKVILKTKDDGSYIYFGKNVNVKSAFEGNDDTAVANREVFSRYLGISKLVLEYDEGDLPLRYDESDRTADYLTMDSDGVYRLKYRIKLKNDAAVDLANTTYNCKLYVDINADGRFSEDEVLSGLNISDGSGSEKYTDEKGKYHLRVGSTYHISRAIPEGYTGFLAWKLVFEQNEKEFDGVSARALIRSAVEGYSAVPHTGEKPLIKILQIVHEDGSTNLDLKNDSYMKSCYNDSKLDFRIEVSQISSKNYISKTGFNNKSYAEYLKEYDMLVMGFKDVYLIGKDKNGKVDDKVVKEAILAIREYALAGHSILFTHDLNSFNIDKNASKLWGKYANQMLRDIQGMDRFGVMSQYEKVDFTQDKYKYESKYDTPMLKGNSISTSAKQAMSNPLILNYKKNATYGENARYISWNYGLHKKYDGSSISNSVVASLNRGQITEYPYYIRESFTITASHPQYMQLNLDTDSRDSNTSDDIVVWYTLGKLSGVNDDYYAAVEMDARNNFFIYNKGNITYTGSGHKSVTSEEEKRLFLNTLVAAYRAGMHAPRVLYKENEWNTSATITSKYLPYDPQMVRNTGEVDENGNPITGGFLEETLPVHFYTTNENLQLTNEELYAEYYIDGTKNDSDIYLDGKYYKKVTPVKVERLVEEGGQVTRANEDALRPANNSLHTATFDYASIGLGSTESIKDKYSTNIYIRLGYESLVVPKDGSKEISLPASESFSKLNIVCTQLFELR